MLEKVREILVESLNIEGSEVVPTARLNEITNCTRCNRHY